MRTMWNVFRTVGVAMIVTVLAVVVFGQQRAQTSEKPKGGDIVRGTVVSATPSAIEVRDKTGAVQTVAVSDTTLVLADDEDFSVANLPNIELTATDLSAGDAVEVVVESGKTRLVAGIVTRISPIDASATARAGSRP